MNPTMTLEQVRDKLRSVRNDPAGNYLLDEECELLADAVDAHLAERAALLAQPSKAQGGNGVIAWMTHHDQPMLFFLIARKLHLIAMTMSRRSSYLHNQPPQQSSL